VRGGGERERELVWIASSYILNVFWRTTELKKCLYYTIQKLVPSYLPYKPKYKPTPYFLLVYLEKKFRRFDNIINKF
jgi:hypothetical protein